MCLACLLACLSACQTTTPEPATKQARILTALSGTDKDSLVEATTRLPEVFEGLAPEEKRLATARIMELILHEDWMIAANALRVTGGNGLKLTADAQHLKRIEEAVEKWNKKNGRPKRKMVILYDEKPCPLVYLHMSS
jgi:hypothetical protein